MSSNNAQMIDTVDSNEASIDLRNKLIRLNWLQHRRFAQELAHQHLTVPQYYTLSTLVSLGGEATMGQLARKTYQVSATMTGIVDRLVRDGLVERRRDEEDRRTVIVSITPIGQEVVDTAWSAALISLEQAMNRLSPSERDAAYSFVDSLVDVMED